MVLQENVHVGIKTDSEMGGKGKRGTQNIWSITHVQFFCTRFFLKQQLGAKSLIVIKPNQNGLGSPSDSLDTQYEMFSANRTGHTLFVQKFWARKNPIPSMIDRGQTEQIHKTLDFDQTWQTGQTFTRGAVFVLYQDVKPQSFAPPAKVQGRQAVAVIVKNTRGSQKREVPIDTR